MASKPRIILISAGIKNGPLPAADYHLDCRCVIDPSSVGMGSGDNKATQDYVLKTSPEAVNGLFKCAVQAIKAVPTRRREKKDPWEKPFTILCFCAHGVHRSRAMKHILGDYLKDQWIDGQLVKVEVK